ncbi:MAG: hypothetical protein ACKO2G_14370 [Verrucomicrobiales bacterium]
MMRRRPILHGLFGALAAMSPVPLFADREARPDTGRRRPLRTSLTNKDGRSIEVRILEVEDSAVMVQLPADKRTMPIELARLADDDADYLREIRALSDPVWGKRDMDIPPAPSAASWIEPPIGGAYYNRTRKDIEAGIQRILAKPAPPGVPAPIQAAENSLNLYRFLSNVPHEVVADAVLNERAREAALACERAGRSGHDHGHFTDSCNITTDIGEPTVVYRGVEDAGENNRGIMGHRAWILNPPMARTGFGAGNNGFSTMWVLDNSGRAASGVWSYPSEGLFPLRYLHGDEWSFYGAPDPGKPENVRVEVHRLHERITQTLSPRDPLPGLALKVPRIGISRATGVAAINFEVERPYRHGNHAVRISTAEWMKQFVVELY